MSPDAVIGYSLGESAGLFAMNVWRERDEMLIDTWAGRLRSRTVQNDRPAMGSGTCSVRPEASRIEAGDVPAGGGAGRDTGGDGAVVRNRLQATRSDVVYLGEVAQHHLIADGDIALTSYELNPRPINGGDQKVTVTFAPEAVVVLRD